MNLKRYTARSNNPDFFFEATIEVDHDILTPELATQINAFWSEADSRLAEHDDDPVKTVVACAMQSFVLSAMNDYNEHGCMRDLHDEEGWPPEGELGLKLISIEVPSRDFDTITVIAED